MPGDIEENNVDVNRPTDRANIEQSDFLKVKQSKKSRYLQLSCELLMTQVVNIVCSYVLLYHPFQPYKSRHPWQPKESRRPPILNPKQPKVAIFDKIDFWGLKYPPEMQVQHKTCSLYAGHLHQPFQTIKIRPGQQEGPGKVIFIGPLI